MDSNNFCIDAVARAARHTSWQQDYEGVRGLQVRKLCIKQDLFEYIWRWFGEKTSLIRDTNWMYGRLWRISAEVSGWGCL